MDGSKCIHRTQCIIRKRNYGVFSHLFRNIQDIRVFPRNKVHSRQYRRFIVPQRVDQPVHPALQRPVFFPDGLNTVQFNLCPGRFFSGFPLCPFGQDCFHRLHRITAVCTEPVRLAEQFPFFVSRKKPHAHQHHCCRRDHGNPERNPFPFRRFCFFDLPLYLRKHGRLQINPGEALIKGFTDHLIPFFFILHRMLLLPDSSSSGHRPDAVFWKPPSGKDAADQQFPGC